MTKIILQFSIDKIDNIYYNIYRVKKGGYNMTDLEKILNLLDEAAIPNTYDEIVRIGAKYCDNSCVYFYFDENGKIIKME